MKDIYTKITRKKYKRKKRFIKNYSIKPKKDINKKKSIQYSIYVIIEFSYKFKLTKWIPQNLSSVYLILVRPLLRQHLRNIPKSVQTCPFATYFKLQKQSTPTASATKINLILRTESTSESKQDKYQELYHAYSEKVDRVNVCEDQMEYYRL